MKSIPIKWTDNPNRISGLFVRVNHETQQYEVSTLGGVIHINRINSENMEEVRKKIGVLLAGKPVGDTFKILQENLE